MAICATSKLNLKKKYLQVALNSTPEEAKKIISSLPISYRIIVEAGTPLIKQYGEHLASYEDGFHAYEKAFFTGQLLPIARSAEHSFGRVHFALL